MARKKPAAKKAARKKKSAAKSAGARGKKTVLKKKSAAAAKKVPKKQARKRAPARRPRSRAINEDEPLIPRGRGLGPDSGGQSGDVQGLRGAAFGDSESVEELIEDGQSFEAEIVSGVEDAPDPDQGEIRTREVPEDDVPPEYLENQ
ncbi:MAG TPA: hypothetical protein VMB47_00655 [Candidatus Aquilonibacter sp.]|nr:hypothetical protein [Candidatus Aquilonibacter sp.]